MNNQTFDCDYFLNLFRNIPDDKWCRHRVTSDIDNDTHCALGHLGMRSGCLRAPKSAIALDELLTRETGLCTAQINDLKTTKFPQLTPKSRILAALNYIKSKQPPPPQQVKQAQHECCHMWLECGVCMICSATKPVVPVEVGCD